MLISSPSASKSAFFEIKMANIQQTVKLFFKATGLSDKDITSKSDPYLVLYAAGESGSGNFAPASNQNALSKAGVTFFGRTETAKNNLSPVWKTSIEVPFLFESKQNFRVAIYDDDGQGQAGDDPLGQVDFLLSSVVCSRGMTKSFPLTPRGSVEITAVQVSGTDDSVSIKFRGAQMEKMDTLSKSDCYFILRRRIGSQLRDLYKSETVDDSLEPIWKDAVFQFNDITGAKTDEAGLEFFCFDEDVTSDEPMGSFTCSYDELVEHFNKKTPFELKDSSGKNFGKIYVDRLTLVHNPTFADYLQSGWQINLAVSIDFTGSNGNPASPSSLHFMNPNQPNQYLQAIMSVGEILIEYDTDKQIPVFGFGAQIGRDTQHFFHVNQTPNPYVNGIQGIINAYGQFLPTCQLSGPTNFAPTIKSVTEGCRQQQAAEAKSYTVLLILTDGDITDIDQTIDAVVAADDVPLSIVIVGIGNGSDFAAMNVLDGDDGALRDSKRRAIRRDLVQFVPFRDYVNKPRTSLAQNVLKEIPQQFVKYAKLRNIKPTI